MVATQGLGPGRDSVDREVSAFVDAHRGLLDDREAFLGARYDAGLAWVHHPEGLGGRGWPRAAQAMVTTAFSAHAVPDNSYREPDIGLGMAAPTIAAYANRALAERLLRPLYTGEERWCQLFSEPGAGSDLAAVSTRASLEDGVWIVDGQKVWTSNAHNATWGILLARTDPDVPKHAGLSFFICDMRHAGVTVRPLRLLTGDAEFNEVFLASVEIPDAHRLGEIGDGWRVAQTTLSNERVVIGAGGGNLTDRLVERWNADPSTRTDDTKSRLLRLRVEAEVYRWQADIAMQRSSDGQPGAEGSGMKLTFAALSQAVTALEVEMGGAEGTSYDDWSFILTEHAGFDAGPPARRYLRARGNSIEGGTSEILRNIIAERVLGLPPERRVDKDRPWKETR